MSIVSITNKGRDEGRTLCFVYYKRNTTCEEGGEKSNSGGGNGQRRVHPDRISARKQYMRRRSTLRTKIWAFKRV